MNGSPLPALAQCTAPAAWRAIEFISDLHLSPAMPRTLAALEAHLHGTDADAVFILGDLFEVWIGDDTRGLPFEQRCVSLLRQAARHRVIGFMAGNRDFLAGPALLADAGLERLHDPTVLHAFGSPWLLSHGDALCLDDVDYQAFRRMVREPAWQQAFLARPIDERAGIAQAIRQESRTRKAGQPDPAAWADVDAGAACVLLHAASSTTLIHGHTHRPGEHDLGAGRRRVVLSDWDLDDAGHPRAEVLRLDATGLSRRRPVDRV